MKSVIFSSVLFLAVASTSYARTFNDHSNNDHSTNNPAGVRNVKKSAVVVRNIASDKLPSKLLNSVKKNYKDYWITELYKQVSNGKTSYHITLENADQKVRLTANAPTNWATKRIVLKDADLL